MRLSRREVIQMVCAEVDMIRRDLQTSMTYLHDALLDASLSTPGGQDLSAWSLPPEAIGRAAAAEGAESSCWYTADTACELSRCACWSAAATGVKQLMRTHDQQWELWNTRLYTCTCTDLRLCCRGRTGTPALL